MLATKELTTEERALEELNKQFSEYLAAHPLPFTVEDTQVAPLIRSTSLEQEYSIDYAHRFITYDMVGETLVPIDLPVASITTSCAVSNFENSTDFSSIIEKLYYQVRSVYCRAIASGTPPVEYAVVTSTYDPAAAKATLTIKVPLASTTIQPGDELLLMLPKKGTSEVSSIPVGVVSAIDIDSEAQAQIVFEEVPVLTEQMQNEPVLAPAYLVNLNGAGFLPYGEMLEIRKYSKKEIAEEEESFFCSSRKEFSSYSDILKILISLRLQDRFANYQLFVGSDFIGKVGEALGTDPDFEMFDEVNNLKIHYMPCLRSTALLFDIDSLHKVTDGEPTITARKLSDGRTLLTYAEFCNYYCTDPSKQVILSYRGLNY